MIYRKNVRKITHGNIMCWHKFMIEIFKKISSNMQQTRQVNVTSTSNVQQTKQVNATDSNLLL